MTKYIIVGLIVILGGWLVLFLVQNGSSFTKQVSTTGGNSAIAPVNQSTNTVPDKSLTINTTDDNSSINNQSPSNQMTTATIHTNKGDITIEFFPKDAPNTVANFIKLAQDGFYDGTKFHRVIQGFMIQGGDPLTKDDSMMDSWGTGGPGYQFPDEINPNSKLYKTGYVKGRVAMANSGPDTNGSQFFIMTADYPLPPSYTIFGKVDVGQDVVDTIANVPTTQPGVLDRPVAPIIINSITLK